MRNTKRVESYIYRDREGKRFGFGALKKFKIVNLIKEVLKKRLVRRPRTGKTSRISEYRRCPETRSISDYIQTIY